MFLNKKTSVKLLSLVHTKSVIGVKRVIDVNELLTLLDVIGVRVISKSFDILTPVLCSCL